MSTKAEYLPKQKPQGNHKGFSTAWGLSFKQLQQQELKTQTNFLGAVEVPVHGSGAVQQRVAVVSDNGVHHSGAVEVGAQRLGFTLGSQPRYSQVVQQQATLETRTALLAKMNEKFGFSVFSSKMYV